MYPQVNPTARNWCHAKKVCRQYVNGTTICLREHVPKSLEAVSVDVNKFFRTCRDYEMAYRSGCTGKDVEITDFGMLTEYGWHSSGVEKRATRFWVEERRKVTIRFTLQPQWGHSTHLTDSLNQALHKIQGHDKPKCARQASETPIDLASNLLVSTCVYCVYTLRENSYVSNQY